MQGASCGDCSSELRVKGLYVRMLGLGISVCGLGFRAWDLVLWFWVLGFKF